VEIYFTPHFGAARGLGLSQDQLKFGGNRMRAFHTTVALLALLLTIIPISASAADLKVKAPPAPPPPPPFSWSGFYIGGNFGGAWAHHDITDNLFGINFNDGNNNGVFIGGGQAGFNYQFSNFVIGVEGDFDWAAKNNNAGNGVFVPLLGQTVQVTSNDTWIATLAARFGVAVDRVLFYGKAGGGWIGNDGFTVTNLTTGRSFTGSNSNTLSGWLVGAGLEWAIANNWSVRFEYDFLGLNGRTFTVPAGSVFLAGDTFTTGGNNVQMATVGINFRFGTYGMYGM
jgi:outer membrane immunogenic protein